MTRSCYGAVMAAASVCWACWPPSSHPSLSAAFISIVAGKAEGWGLFLMPLGKVGGKKRLQFVAN